MTADLLNGATGLSGAVVKLQPDGSVVKRGSLRVAEQGEWIKSAKLARTSTFLPTVHVIERSGLFGGYSMERLAPLPSDYLSLSGLQLLSHVHHGLVNYIWNIGNPPLQPWDQRATETKVLNILEAQAAPSTLVNDVIGMFEYWRMPNMAQAHGDMTYENLMWRQVLEDNHPGQIVFTDPIPPTPAIASPTGSMLSKRRRTTRPRTKASGGLLRRWKN
jgi:hypothetical protein